MLTSSLPLRWVALLLIIGGCSDESDPSTTPSRGLPLFQAAPVTMPEVGIATVGLSQPGASLVAAILTSDGALWTYPLEGAASPTEVLSGLTVPIESDVQVVRRPDGTIDALWLASGDVHHASGQGTAGWSTSVVFAGTVDERTRPSLAVGADGSLHAAWVGLQSGDWSAFYGSWNGSSWVNEAVRSVESTFQWAGLAVSGSTVLLAGTNTDGSLWLTQKDGNTWNDQPLDFGNTRPNVGRTQAIAAGPAGVAIMFGSNPRTYGAWRPAGASSFEVDEVGEAYTGFVWEPQLRVGNAIAFTAATRDERVSGWERGAPFWPRVASFPQDSLCSADDRAVAVSLDAQDQPVLLVRGCSGELQLLRQIDSYPEDWNERCAAAVTKLCDLACACPSADSACAYGYSNGNSPGGNRSGCELNARDNLCGDSASPPDELESCVATLEPATCGTYGYPMDDACLALIE